MLRKQLHVVTLDACWKWPNIIWIGKQQLEDGKLGKTPGITPKIAARNKSNNRTTQIYYSEYEAHHLSLGVISKT
jgi:hypothetical protein